MTRPPDDAATDRPGGPDHDDRAVDGRACGGRAYDDRVRRLAERFPLLLADVARAVAADPATARLRPSSAGPRVVQQGRCDVLFHCRSAVAAVEQLAELGPDRQMVQWFTLADFLQFLTQPRAGECLEHPDWFPLLVLPLRQSEHARQWLNQTSPRDWPWCLLQEQAGFDEGESRVLKDMGADLAAIVGDFTTQLADHLRDAYPARPALAELAARHLADDEAGAGPARDRPLRVLVYAPGPGARPRQTARDLAAGLICHGVDARALTLLPGPAGHFALLEQLARFDPDVLLLPRAARADCPPLPAGLSVLPWDGDTLAGADASADPSGHADLAGATRRRVKELLRRLASNAPGDPPADVHRAA